jgi:FkbM family methyltransferase
MHQTRWLRRAVTGLRRLRPVDLSIIGVVFAFLVGALLYQARYGSFSGDPDVAAGELAFFRQAYGPDKYSRHGEEWFVRDFFADRRGGTFVDVGAYDYKEDSNTYYLETILGWSGIAVDANPMFAEGYQRHRPRTRYVSFFVSDRSDDEVTLHIPRSFPLMASGDRAFASLTGSDLDSRTVRTITLTDLLERAGIETFDFLSMDVELAEPKALAGFDIRRFRPALVCIESHPQVRQDVLDYFAKAEYVVVGRYLRADQWNLWFMPAGKDPPIGFVTGDALDGPAVERD